MMNKKSEEWKMSELRMPKGWTLFGTNSFSEPIDENERRKRNRQADKMLRNAKPLKASELYEQSNKAFIEKTAREESYEKAKAAGKLWTQEQKDAAKAEKKAARKAKRLAK